MLLNFGIRGRSILVIPFVLAIAAVPLVAQDVVDQGSFEVSLDGRPAGTEEFSIRQSGSGGSAETTAAARVRLRVPEGVLELAPRLRTTGVRSDPVAYQVDVGGTAPRKIVGTVGGGRFSAKIVTPAGEQLREYVASNGAVVLEDGVAHHYYFLAQRLREGQIPVLVPRESRQVAARVENLGEQQIQIAGQNVPAYHLLVRLRPEEERHVWLDALNRVLRVEHCRIAAGRCVPTYVAVRTERPR